MTNPTYKVKINPGYSHVSELHGYSLWEALKFCKFWNADKIETIKPTR